MSWRIYPKHGYKARFEHDCGGRVKMVVAWDCFMHEEDAGDGAKKTRFFSFAAQDLASP